MILATNDIEEDESIPAFVWDQIESLLSTSVFDEEQRSEFLRNAQSMDRSNYEWFLSVLYLNQQDPITHRGNHSMTEIKYHLRKLR